MIFLKYLIYKCFTICKNAAILQRPENKVKKFLKKTQPLPHQFFFTYVHGSMYKVEELIYIQNLCLPNSLLEKIQILQYKRVP